MMACSYLSTAGIKQEPSSAACWTPPALAGLPYLEGPTTSSIPYMRAPLVGIGVPTATPFPAVLPEPALDLSTTTSSLNPRFPTSPRDDVSE